jgi:hypothetical protein
MFSNYGQYNGKTTIFRITPLVNSKDGIDFAMLFGLRLLQRWGLPLFAALAAVVARKITLYGRLI